VLDITKDGIWKGSDASQEPGKFGRAFSSFWAEKKQQARAEVLLSRITRALESSELCDWRGGPKICIDFQKVYGNFLG